MLHIYEYRNSWTKPENVNKCQFKTFRTNNIFAVLRRKDRHRFASATSPAALASPTDRCGKLHASGCWVLSLPTRVVHSRYYPQRCICPRWRKPWMCPSPGPQLMSWTLDHYWNQRLCLLISLSCKTNTNSCIFNFGNDLTSTICHTECS